MDILELLKNFLDTVNRLITFPAKRKMKLYALYYLSTKFEKGKTYTEKEVNSILNAWTCFNDPATLHRELYNHGFLNRERNGSIYWLEENQPDLDELEARYS